MSLELLVVLLVLGIIVGSGLGFVAFVRLHRLSARVTHLEQATAGGALERRQAPSAAAPATVPATRAGALPPLPPRPAGHRSDLESLIAGRWLNRVGLLLVFFAAFFALKWEFDNNVLGPMGRVALWTLIGATLLAFSQWLLDRGYRYLSEGLTGLGGSLLYLTLHFGWDNYNLFPQSVAFLAMIAVTGALLALAVGRNSQHIALLGLIGGFLTPLLAGSGRDAQVILFSYLLILDAGLLVLARLKQWRGLEPLAFTATTAFFWGWYASFYDVSEPLVRTTTFATMFLAIFAALPVIRSRSTGRIFPEQVAQMVLNAGNYLLALYAMLWPEQRWTLTAAVVALAAMHIVIANAIPHAPGARPVARMLFAGLALTFVTLAIPIRLDGHWITMAWAVEGAVLIWTGFAVRWWFLRAAGLLLYGIAVVRIPGVALHADAFLLNERFATFLVLIACFGAALYFWSRNGDQLGQWERRFFSALGVGINVLAVWALSLEVNEYFESPPSTEFVDPAAMTAARSAELSRQVALSLLWTVYATSLVITGVRQGIAAVRWQGLVLFGLVAGKVFFVDMSYLSGGYRVLSSIVLGIVLIAVSVLYQRRLSAQTALQRP
jgi:uncharacterized membrane protein